MLLWGEICCRVASLARDDLDDQPRGRHQLKGQVVPRLDLLETPSSVSLCYELFSRLLAA